MGWTCCTKREKVVNKILVINPKGGYHSVDPHSNEAVSLKWILGMRFVNI
jgi:hypothetical protein